MQTRMLRIITPEQLPSLRRDVVDANTLAAAARIVQDVQDRGEAAVIEHAQRLGDRKPGEPLVYGQDALNDALRSIPNATRDVLTRTAERIRRFAEQQRGCLRELDMAVAGGRAGHSILPVERAACYAPGGRFPLPSSVLMTVVTARAAGVQSVWVASPKPSVETLAAAAIAGADACLAVGGAQAIAALAFGAGDIPACDVIVGPGNRWVTAAKQLVCGRVAIDMLAGPSELLVVADQGADAAVIAADLLAQAEHDPDAMPMLIATEQELLDAVDAELARQLSDLPTAETAREAVKNGFSLLVPDIDAAIRVANKLAPEHLELMIEDAHSKAVRFTNYGALFIGSNSAEVLGDYGAGPNHVLPTGGTSRFVGGLSVFHFLRTRTWLRIEHPEEGAEMIRDAEALAQVEGLIGHARSAAIRRR